MSIQFTLAARYLFGRPLRTILTTLAVVFGVLVLFSMNTFLPSVLAAFQGNLLAEFEQVDLTITQRTGEAFSPEVLETIRGVKGVRVVDGFINRTLNLPSNFVDNDPNQPDTVIALSLVGLDVESAQQIRSYVISEGHFLEPGDLDAVVITTSLADAFHAKLGDTIALPTTQGTVQLTIVGLRPARTIAGNEEVLVTLPEAQTLLNQPGLINTIDVGFLSSDESARTATREAIAEAVGQNYRLGGLSSGAEFFAMLEIGQVIISLFGVVALVMGGFIIFNSFRTVVVERRRDIAMLRALGANRATVLGIIVAEGFLQGALGTLIGMIFGYLVALGISYAADQFGGAVLKVKIGGPTVTPALALLTVVLGIGVTIASGLIPAFGASNISPLEALRPSDTERSQRTLRWSAITGAVFLVLAGLGLASGSVILAGVGALLCLAGLVLLGPALVKPIASVLSGWMAATFARDGVSAVAEGNLTRQPTRAAITASTTMIGLAVIVMMGALVTSVIGTFLDIFKMTVGTDYLLIPPSISVWANVVGADESLANQLRAVEGVDVVTTLRFAASSAPSPSSMSLKSTSGEVAVSLLGLDPVVYPQVAGLSFEAGDPEAAWRQLSEGRNIIINGPMASVFQISVGDTIQLATPNGAQGYRVVAIANDFLNAKITTGYISQANLATDFKKTEDIFLQLNLKPDADPAVVEPKLKAVVANYPQFTLTTGQAYFDQNQILVYRGMGALYVAYVLLALPSLIASINTLAIGVLERTRELGMLRAVGATRKQMQRMVLAEALLLAAVGTAFGLLAGLYLSVLMVSALKVGGFTIMYQFPLYGVLSAIAVGLLTGVVAAIIPARQVARLEIVEALRYE